MRLFTLENDLLRSVTVFRTNENTKQRRYWPRRVNQKLNFI